MVRHRRRFEVVADRSSSVTIPAKTQAKLLAAIREAHATSRIGMQEFVTLTDRALGPLSAGEADQLLREIGYRLTWAENGSALGRVIRRAFPPLCAGLGSFACVMAAPAALGVPVGPWVGLAIATGALIAGLFVIVQAAWALFPEISWRARRAQRDGQGPHPRTCSGHCASTSPTGSSCTRVTSKGAGELG